MKNIIILILILSQIPFLFSQDYQLEWQQCYGGTGVDRAFDILQKQDGYIIAGWTSSQDVDISFNLGGSDFWLVKIDTIGNIMWEKTYGGSEADNLIKIFPTQDGGYYLLGMSYSNDGDISNDPYPDSWDFWIVKIDSTASIIWEKIVGGNGGDYITAGTPTNDGGIVALGYSGSEYGDVSINYGLYDIWMIKLSSEGEIEWDFTLGTDWQDYGNAIIQTSDGGFLVGGTSKLTGGGNLNCECHGQADGVLVKLDADRNIEWQKCYGGSDYDGITALVEINDGYVFGAYVNSNDGDISGYHGGVDIWIVKVDYSGNILWQNPLGGSNSEFISTIILTEDGSLIIPGYTQSNNGDVSGNHTLSEYYNDIWMVKLSSEGGLLSQQCIGGVGNEILDFGIVKKSDNNFIIAGQTNWGPSYDVQCTPHGEDDFWVFEIKDTTTNIADNQIGVQEIKVYPNPARDYVLFELNEYPINGKIQMVNIFGQTVETLLVKSEKTVWDTRQTKKGIYFYNVEINGKVFSGKIVVQ